MLWRKKCQNLVLSFDREDVVFVDMLGKPASVKNIGKGVYSLDVTGVPVYFTGAKLISVEE